MTWGAENIVPHLQALGMQDAFIKGTADFSGIDGTRDLADQQCVSQGIR